MPRINLRSILLVAILAFFSQSTFSQTHPPCLSSASDATGDGYGWENNRTCIVDITSTTAQTFTNLETGIPVTLVRAYWDGLNDFDDAVTCTNYYYDGTNYNWSNSWLYEFSPLSTTAPFVGEVKITRTSSQVVLPWGVSNGIYSGPSDLGRSPWVEIVSVPANPGFPTAGPSRTVRTWLSDQAFTECRTTNPFVEFVPSGTPPDTGTNFDGSCVEAGPVGDGWGWNGTESCRLTTVDVTQNDQCDYSNASLYDGWGWDSVNSQSCAPQTTSDACDYSNADASDGWGWNAVNGTSCAPR